MIGAKKLITLRWDVSFIGRFYDSIKVTNVGAINPNELTVDE